MWTLYKDRKEGGKKGKKEKEKDSKVVLPSYVNFHPSSVDLIQGCVLTLYSRLLDHYSLDLFFFGTGYS